MRTKLTPTHNQPTCKHNDPLTYHYAMTYGITTPESAEIGDYADEGFHIEQSETFTNLPDLLNDREITNNTWIEWSTSDPSGSPHEWLTSHHETDYSTGNETTYNLFIYRSDGQDLSFDEISTINNLLQCNNIVQA